MINRLFTPTEIAERILDGKSANYDSQERLAKAYLEAVKKLESLQK